MDGRMHKSHLEINIILEKSLLVKNYQEKFSDH